MEVSKFPEKLFDKYTRIRQHINTLLRLLTFAISYYLSGFSAVVSKAINLQQNKFIGDGRCHIRGIFTSKYTILNLPCSLTVIITPRLSLIDILRDGGRRDLTKNLFTKVNICRG